MTLNNETRKLMKLLDLDMDEIYHVFCLALSMADFDGQLNSEEGEFLTRIGFGLGLSPADISALGGNAISAIAETSKSDVIAFSVASLKARLDKAQLEGVIQILRFVAVSDDKVDSSEKEFLQLLSEMWLNDED